MIRLRRRSIAGPRYADRDEGPCTEGPGRTLAVLAKATETDVARAKAALATHAGKLVLTPAMRDGRPVYQVTGHVTVTQGAGNRRMQMVARDGLEPPTPAFSGLRSTN